MEISGSQFDKQLMEFAQKHGIWLGGGWRTRTLEVAASEHPELRKPKRKGRKPAAKVGGLGAAALRFVDVNKDDAEIVEQIESTTKCCLPRARSPCPVKK